MKDKENIKRVTVVIHPGYDIEARLADDIKITESEEKEMAKAAGVNLSDIHSLDRSIAEIISSLDNLYYTAKFSS